MSETQYVRGDALRPYDVVVWPNGSIGTVLGKDQATKTVHVLAGAHHPILAGQLWRDGGLGSEAVGYDPHRMYLILYRSS